MTRLSIIVPCHNYGAYLARALESVVAQNDPEWEVIIVDDGSTDDTPSVAEAWQAAHPEHIRWLTQDNAGPGAARNRGAREATGDWRLFLDADDVLLPGALARYREAASENPDAALIVAGAETLRDGVVTDTRDAGAVSDDRTENFAAFVRGKLCPFNGGAVMLHRRVTDRLSYPESIRTSEDFVFFAQAFSLFDCASAVKPAVAMHRHADSLRYNQSALDSARETMIDLLFDPAILPAPAMAYRNEVESTWCLVVSRAFHRHGQHGEAVRYYRKGIRLYPRHLLRTGYLGNFVGSLLKNCVGR